MFSSIREFLVNFLHPAKHQPIVHVWQYNNESGFLPGMPKDWFFCAASMKFGTVFFSAESWQEAVDELVKQFPEMKNPRVESTTLLRGRVSMTREYMRKEFHRSIDLSAKD
jgi:hypothetical protein